MYSTKGQILWITIFSISEEFFWCISWISLSIISVSNPSNNDDRFGIKTFCSDIFIKLQYMEKLVTTLHWGIFIIWIEKKMIVQNVESLVAVSIDWQIIGMTHIILLFSAPFKPHPSRWDFFWTQSFCELVEFSRAVSWSYKRSI